MLATDKVKLNTLGTVYSYTFSGYEYPQTPNQWYSAGGISVPPGVYLCFGQLYTNASNTLLQISIQLNNSFSDNGGAWQQFGNCQTATICVPYTLENTATLYLFGNHSNATGYYGFTYSKFNITRIG